MFKLFSRFYTKQKKSNTKSDNNKKKSDPKRRVTESTEDNLSYLECFQNNHEILRKFEILEKIGGGSFGQIFKVKDKVSNQIVAMKIEKKREGKQLMVYREYQIMKDFKNETGFAQLHSYLKNDDYSYLVMSNLGPNLETLKISKGGSFSLKTTLMIGYQIISRIQTFHNKNFLHRDIKPENFVIGSIEDDKYIYLIDFGLSRSYIQEDGSHIPFRDKKGMVGTARYVSINTHLGYEQSRRDDLESIGYILVYLCKGGLPWQNLPAKNKEEKYEKILDIKKKTSVEELCKNLPTKFIDYFNYVKSLPFKSTPDYENLKDLFISMMKENEIKINYKFDWSKKTNKAESSSELYSKFDIDLNESDNDHTQKNTVRFTNEINDYKLISHVMIKNNLLNSKHLHEDESSKYINYNSSFLNEEEEEKDNFPHNYPISLTQKYKNFPVNDNNLVSKNRKSISVDKEDRNISLVSKLEYKQTNF